MMTDDEQTELESAIELAVSSHQGQTDKQGEPYILHVLRVMLAVPARLRVAGVLHDVIEDTGMTHDDLLANGITVPNVALIDTLTRRHNAEGTEKESYATYIDRVAMNADASTVKVADLRDNVGRIETLYERNDGEAERLMRRYSAALGKLVAG